MLVTKIIYHNEKKDFYIQICVCDTYSYVQLKNKQFDKKKQKITNYNYSIFMKVSNIFLLDSVKWHKKHIELCPQSEWDLDDNCNKPIVDENKMEITSQSFT